MTEIPNARRGDLSDYRGSVTGSHRHVSHPRALYVHLIASLVTVAVLAAACGDDSGGAGGSDPEPEFGSEEFGLTFAELTDRVEEVEQAVGECMSAAGFEYVPVDFAGVREAMTSDKSAPGMSEDEFLETFGFGVTTQPDKPIVELSLGSDNSAIVAELSEADRVAYMRTLYGENTDATFAFGLEDEDFSRIGGCTRTAVEQFFTAEEMTGTYFNPGDAVIEQDPRVQDAIAEYADCMADEGFDFGHPDVVEDTLWERLDSILEGRDQTTLTGADLEELQELQAFELGVVPVSVECEEDVLEPVIDDVEEEIYGSDQS